METGGGRAARWAPVLAAVTLAAGCATGPDVQVPTQAGAASLSVSAAAFTDGGELPVEYTCDGAGDFPAVSWGELPAGTAAVALLVHDPDAPGGDYVHRLVSNLDAAVGVLDTATPPDGALELRTSDGTDGWVAPCPPPGDEAHRYVFTVYALNRPTRLPGTAQTQTAIATVTEAAIASGSVTARYGRA